MMLLKALFLFFSFIALTSTVTVVHSASVSAPNNANDLEVLNFALTLEHLEANFYTHFQGVFNSTDFVNAGYAAGVYNYVDVVMAHEQAHVSTLNKTIVSLGGSPVPVCTYNFSAVTSPATYIQVAATLEGTGVMAYDGTLNHLSNPDLQQVAATIATVEARHAAYFETLLAKNPFPAALDTAGNPIDIAKAASQFIVSCPYDFVYPTVRPGGVALDNDGKTKQTGNSNYTGSYSSKQKQNDMYTLNYALTLEHLEATFYATYLAQFNTTAFQNAGYNSSVRNYISMIGDHETAHVNALTSTIKSRGGNPVSACNYTFNVSSVQDFISVAASLETTGVSAYDGAANTLTDTNLQQVAATIATVEGRHTSYLRNLLNHTPFPSTFDAVLTPAQVIKAASVYFASCPSGSNPASLPLPQVIAAPAPSPASSDDSAASSLNSPLSALLAFF